jgi:hypothetical protein
VSVMGNLGEHYAVALYQGARGLYGFWDMQAGLEDDPFMVLEVPQLQASWEDRDALEKTDRQVIKDLGLKFRGRKAWPQFQSYRPGYFPWQLEADEVRALTVALEQVLDVAPRVRATADLLPDPEEERYLVRVPRGAGNAMIWEDTIQPMPPPPTAQLVMPIDPAQLEQVKALPKTRAKFEMELFVLPTPIQESRKQRPAFPYILLAVDGGSGMVIGTELMVAEPTLESIFERVPQTALRYFANLEVHPRIIYVADHRLADLLGQLAHELGCRVIVRRNLRALSEAKMSFMAYVRGGMPPF